MEAFNYMECSIPEGQTIDSYRRARIGNQRLTLRRRVIQWLQSVNQ